MPSAWLVSMSASDAELDRILAALAHPLRRRILRILGARSKVAYSELLRELGVESSILSFHLKKLQGLVEKDSRGEYMLGREGFAALRILRLITGEEGGSGRGVVVSSQVVLLVDDDLLLEAYKKGGLELRDIGVVFVDNNVSRSLYKKVLRRITAIVVYVPEGLRGYTAGISSSELVIGYRKPPFNPAKPVEIIADLEKRGFLRIADKIREKLGLAKHT